VTAVWDCRIRLADWETASEVRDVIEVTTGRRLGQIGLATAQDVDRAVRSAAASQADWEGKAVADRTAVLERLGAVLADQEAEYRHWLVREAGATRAKAVRELRVAAAELAHACTLARGLSERDASDGLREQRVRRQPVGVVGVITPFNAPLVLAMRALAPALATGNAVVLKPDPRTAVSGGLLLVDMFEQAGLPSGLLHVLPGGADVGARLAENPEVGAVLFTGSTTAGRLVGEAAGRTCKRVGLELGGNNPMLVLDDADVDHAAACAVQSSFLHAGQICMSAGRYLVAHALAEPFTDALVALAQQLRVGDPWCDNVDVGPLIDDRSVDRVANLVEQAQAAGARARCGGQADGRWFPPTVLDRVTPDLAVWREEIFGPVAPILAFEDLDEAVAIALDSPYRLVAGIHSSDDDAALALADRLPFGAVRINDVTTHDDPTTPMVGRGWSGNGAGFGGTEVLDLVTVPQVVSLRSSKGVG
jgi:benzaldehyde dehydrogenase (NAD)